ncbi:MAG: hypothetical protein O7F09_03145 [Chloroflexi bacterium]|nr:hypothetical protein [Chloroflexota bacterium]
MIKREKRFSFHWGAGVVAEEVQVEGRYHVPTIQLLKYTEGGAIGEVSVRFCHYSHSGGFRRSPLVMSPEEIDEMREALREAPELREILRRLVEP